VLARIVRPARRHRLGERMLAQTLLRSSSAMALAALLALPPAGAVERSSGKVLTDVMGFAQTYEDGEVLCMEKAAQTDVEKDLASNPDLLGGIQPTDAEWAKARALYIDLHKSACRYDIPLVAEAFSQALDTSLSVSDLEALIAFYRSDLGHKLRESSLRANMAAYRVMMQSESSSAAYATFGEAIAGLLAKRVAAPAPESAPKSVQALPNATAAVALSDRIMKAVANGQAREALDMVKPHTSAPDAQFDAMVEQIRQQKPMVDSRFGESLGYELLRNDTIGDSLIRPMFLHRLERGGMVWLFTWYRGSEGWVLTNVRFVDDANLLFR